MVVVAPIKQAPLRQAQMHFVGGNKPVSLYCKRDGANLMEKQIRVRPSGVTALSVFFLAGTLITFTASLSLLFPDSFLKSIWKLNPRGQEGLVRIGWWAIALLLAVCISCFTAAIGLWRGARWGHRVAFVIIAVNCTGDIVNVVAGTEPRAIVGVPVAGAILVYLMTRRVRRFFSGQTALAK